MLKGKEWEQICVQVGLSIHIATKRLPHSFRSLDPEQNVMQQWPVSKNNNMRKGEEEHPFDIEFKNLKS